MNLSEYLIEAVARRKEVKYRPENDFDYIQSELLRNGYTRLPDDTEDAVFYKQRTYQIYAREDYGSPRAPRYLCVHTKDKIYDMEFHHDKKMTGMILRIVWRYDRSSQIQTTWSETWSETTIEDFINEI